MSICVVEVLDRCDIGEVRDQWRGLQACLLGAVQTWQDGHVILLVEHLAERAVLRLHSTALYGGQQSTMTGTAQRFKVVRTVQWTA